MNVFHKYLYLFWIENIRIYALIVVSAAEKQLKTGCCFNAIEIYSIQTGE